MHFAWFGKAVWTPCSDLSCTERHVSRHTILRLNENHCARIGLTVEACSRHYKVNVGNTAETYLDVERRHIRYVARSRGHWYFNSHGSYLAMDCLQRERPSICALVGVANCKVNCDSYTFSFTEQNEDISEMYIIFIADYFDRWRIHTEWRVDTTCLCSALRYKEGSSDLVWLNSICAKHNKFRSRGWSVGLRVLRLT